MKYFAVIDTNVLVSALLRSASIPGIITQESLDGRIIPLLNDEIIAEYQDVLRRPKFRFDKSAIDTLINGIIKRGIHVDNLMPTDVLLPDPKDIVFYRVVMEVRKDEDAYLVTGNLKHFPAKHFIVTPREMLEILEDDKEYST